MILEAFNDWPVYPATLYTKATTRDSTGQVVESYALGSTVNVWKWVDRSLSQSEGDRFINNELGRIAFEPGPVVNVGDYFLIGSEKYYIIGVQLDIFGMGEVGLVDYRREYAFRN